MSILREKAFELSMSGTEKLFNSLFWHDKAKRPIEEVSVGVLRWLALQGSEKVGSGFEMLDVEKQTQACVTNWRLAGVIELEGDRLRLTPEGDKFLYRQHPDQSPFYLAIKDISERWADVSSWIFGAMGLVLGMLAFFGLDYAKLLHLH